MNQTRLGSLLESLINVILGLAISIAAQLLVFPMFGVFIPFSSNLAIAGIFTVISITRSYLIRRYFNARLHNISLRLAQQLKK